MREVVTKAVQRGEGRLSNVVKVFLGWGGRAAGQATYASELNANFIGHHPPHGSYHQATPGAPPMADAEVVVVPQLRQQQQQLQEEEEQPPVFVVGGGRGCRRLLCFSPRRVGRGR